MNESFNDSVKLNTGVVRATAEDFLNASQSQMYRELFFAALDETRMLAAHNNWFRRIFKRRSLVKVPSVYEIVDTWIKRYSAQEDVPLPARIAMDKVYKGPHYSQLVRLSGLAHSQDDTYVLIDPEIAELLNLTQN